MKNRIGCPFCARSLKEVEKDVWSCAYCVRDYTTKDLLLKTLRIKNKVLKNKKSQLTKKEQKELAWSALNDVEYGDNNDKYVIKIRRIALKVLESTED